MDSRRKNSIDEIHDADLLYQTALNYQSDPQSESQKNAKRYFMKAVIAGHPLAANHVDADDLVAKGDKLRRRGKTDIAIRLFSLAYDKGQYQEAAIRLTQCYLLSKEKGGAEDPNKAFIWLKRAADHGSNQMQYILGNIYSTGESKNYLIESKPISRDLDKAVEYLDKAAQQNEPNAQYQLGQMFEFGLKIKQDLKKAYDLYKKLAEQIDYTSSSTKAMFIPHMLKNANKGSTAALQILNMENINQLLNPDQKAELEQMNKLAIATQKDQEEKHEVAVDDNEARYHMALKLNNENDEGSKKKGRKLFMEGALAGHQLSIDQLSKEELQTIAEIYWKESADYLRSSAKAIEFCTLAFEKGSVRAPVQLFTWYMEGAPDLKADGVKAFAWLKKGADRGDANTQFTIGQYYLQGSTSCKIPQDQAKAYEYFLKAAVQDHPAAQETIEIIIRTLCADKSKHKLKRFFIDTLMPIAENKPTIANNILKFAGIKNLLNKDQIKTLESTRTKEQEKKEREQKAAKEKQERAEKEAREQKIAKEKQERENEKLRKIQEIQQQEKEKAEKEKKPDEILLLVNTFSKIKIELEEQPDFEALTREKNHYQDLYYKNINLGLDKFSTELEPNPTEKRLKNLKLYRDKINDLNNKCKKIENAENEFKTAKEYLFLVCQGLQGQLNDLESKKLEEKLKIEKRPVTLNDFLLARDILTGKVELTDENSKILQDVRRGLKTYFDIINGIVPGYRKILIDEYELLKNKTQSILEMRGSRAKIDLPSDENTIKTSIESLITSWNKSGDPVVTNKVTPTPPPLPKPVFWTNTQTETKTPTEIKPLTLTITTPVAQISPLPSKSKPFIKTPHTRTPHTRTPQHDEKKEQQEQQDTLRKLIELGIAEGSIPRPTVNKTEQEVKSPAVVSALLKIKLKELDQIIKIVSEPPSTEERTYALLCSLAQVSEVAAKDNEARHPTIGMVANHLRNVIFKQHDKLLNEIPLPELLNLARNWSAFLQKDHVGYFPTIEAVIKNVAPESQVLQDIYNLRAEEEEPSIDKSKAKIVSMQDHWVNAFNQTWENTEEEIIHSSAKDFCDAVIGSELTAIRDIKGNLKGLRLLKLQNYFNEIITRAVYIRHPHLELAPTESQSISSLKTTSLFASAVDNINPMYEYEDIDIQAILKARLSEIYLTPALAATYIFGAVDDMKPEQLEQRLDAADKAKIGIRTVLIPCNLGGGHWVGICIKFNNDNKLQEALYVDSMGSETSRVPDTLQAQFRKVFPSNTLDVYPVIHQADFTSCGAYVVENLLHVAQTSLEEKAAPPDLTVQQLRQSHLKALEKHDPVFHAAFYIRQRDNKPTTATLMTQFGFLDSMDKARPSKTELDRIFEMYNLIAELKTTNLKEKILDEFKGNEKTLKDPKLHLSAIRKILADAYFDTDIFDPKKLQDCEILTKLIHVMFGPIEIKNKAVIENTKCIVGYEEILAVPRNNATEKDRNAAHAKLKEMIESDEQLARRLQQEEYAKEPTVIHPGFS